MRKCVQAKDCFSSQVFDELQRLKKSLSLVRMPAAKMEKPGKRVPVTPNRSSSRWDMQNKDLLINDPEETLHISDLFLMNLIV